MKSWRLTSTGLKTDLSCVCFAQAGFRFISAIPPHFHVACYGFRSSNKVRLFLLEVCYTVAMYVVCVDGVYVDFLSHPVFVMHDTSCVMFLLWYIRDIHCEKCDPCFKEHKHLKV